MQRRDTPDDPVISQEECYAAVMLMKHMTGNIISRGDVPEETLEALESFRQSLADVPFPSSDEMDMVHAAICSAILPTFRDGSTPEQAGAARMQLALTNTRQQREN